MMAVAAWLLVTDDGVQTRSNRGNRRTGLMVFFRDAAAALGIGAGSQVPQLLAIASLDSRHRFASSSIVVVLAVHPLHGLLIDVPGD